MKRDRDEDFCPKPRKLKAYLVALGDSCPSCGSKDSEELWACDYFYGFECRSCSQAYNPREHAVHEFEAPDASDGEEEETEHSSVSYLNSVLKHFSSEEFARCAELFKATKALALESGTERELAEMLQEMKIKEPSQVVQELEELFARLKTGAASTSA